MGIQEALNLVCKSSFD